MQPHRLFVGNSRAPVLMLDEAGPDPDSIVELAAQLAPFPGAANNYPGLRRILGPGDTAAWNYVIALLQAAAPYVGGAFDVDGFDLVEASFSMVTTPPSRLPSVQLIPHFDAVEDDLFALLHYLTPCDGTAFYRHAPSGLELVTPDTVDSFVADARRAAQAAAPAYISSDMLGFERIGHVEGLQRRLVAYPGRLLHSGIIGNGFSFSSDPRMGRLTTNIFVRAHQPDQKPDKDLR